MSEWMKSFVGFLMIAGVATQMLPGEKYEKYVRLFLGFFMMILVLQPVLKLGSAEEYLEEKIAEFIQEQEALEEDILEEGEAFRLENEKLQEQTGEKIEIQEIERVHVEVMADD